jgi:Holliday junction DNA helicase RuvA
MIAHLTGQVIEKNLGTIVLDVNGVGYEVSITPKLSSQFQNASKISLIIFTDVRENAIVLYGFNSSIERQTFLLLKKVKGIGSKSAMTILSSIEPEKLMITIGSGDTTALTKIQGIGKKSAERIIVELREQVVEIANESRILSDEIIISRTDSKNYISNIAEDAVLALQKLGFTKDIADKAVKKAIYEKPDSLKDIGDLLKNSLAFLG